MQVEERTNEIMDESSEFTFVNIQTTQKGAPDETPLVSNANAVAEKIRDSLKGESSL